MNCSLVQIQQQCSLSLSQSVSSMRGGKARPKAGFQFSVQKWPVPEASSGYLAKKPCLDTSTERHQGGKKSSGGASASSIESREKVSCGGQHS